jgi:hypothetical protein
LRLAFVAIASMGAALFAAPADAVVPISTYQVDLGPPATTIVQAEATRGRRMAAALEAMACGQEVRFLADVLARKTGEDVVSVLVAKVGWLQLGGRTCMFKREFPISDGFDKDIFNTKFAALYGADCAQPVTYAVKEPPSEIESSEGIDEQHMSATFKLSSSCLRRQINQVIMGLEVYGQLGSSKLPCHLLGSKTEGEWDVAVRDLLRIYFISHNLSTSKLVVARQILDPKTEIHIRDDLLTIDGAPAPDDYALTGCGNTERSTGSPQDRADERSWAEENFEWLGDVWDVLKWILLVILIIVLVILTVLTAGAALPLWAVVPIVAVEIGVTVALVAVSIAMLVRLPETENHLLMINTSRYLTNQIIIDANPDDVHFFVDDQREVKDWLLKRMQSIATGDFLEYNARPYQRYSIIALLNLHDFANDDDLVTATRIVLDLATAKFAAGSDGARRVVPFRRLMEHVEDDVADGHRLMDANEGSDYQVSFMTAYAGLTNQFPEHRVQLNSAFEMIYPATSSWEPPPAVMQVALGEKPEFDQRIHHAGIEIFSRTSSFLVSAGGVQAPAATRGLLGPFVVGENCNDRGAALPTVLIPSGGGYLADPSRKKPALVKQVDFLRIEGYYYYYPRDSKFCGRNNDAQGGPPGGFDPDHEKRNTWSHDANACVYRGFACGTNIVVPDALAEKCLVPQPGTPWSFLSSALCSELPGTRPFFVALYRRTCPSGATACLNNWGFFEAVEAPSNDANLDTAFAAFRAQVLNANPATLIPDPQIRPVPLPWRGPLLPGTYVSSRGQRIEFDAAATMIDGNAPGVRSVDGVAEPNLNAWPLASGGVINTKLCTNTIFPFSVRAGQIEISGSTGGVTIDFCDWQKPKRTEH